MPSSQREKLDPKYWTDFHKWLDKRVVVTLPDLFKDQSLTVQLIGPTLPDHGLLPVPFLWLKRSPVPLVARLVSPEGDEISRGYVSCQDKRHGTFVPRWVNDDTILRWSKSVISTGCVS
jgi:hypothetical protein